MEVSAAALRELAVENFSAEWHAMKNGIQVINEELYNKIEEKHWLLQVRRPANLICFKQDDSSKDRNDHEDNDNDNRSRSASTCLTSTGRLEPKSTSKHRGKGARDGRGCGAADAGTSDFEGSIVSDGLYQDGDASSQDERSEATSLLDPKEVPVLNSTVLNNESTYEDVLSHMFE